MWAGTLVAMPLVLASVPEEHNLWPIVVVSWWHFDGHISLTRHGRCDGYRGDLSETFGKMSWWEVK